VCVNTVRSARVIRQDESKPFESGKGGQMADNKFTLVFVSVVALIASCGLTMGVIALVVTYPYPPPVAALFNALMLGFSGGLAAIFGLLGKPASRAKQTSRKSVTRRH